MAILDEFGRPYQPTTFAHAADRSRTRGPQYQPRVMDIDKLIPAYDREVLVSLSQRLYVNHGIPRAAIDQKADYSVGEAWFPTYTGPTDMADGKTVSSFMRNVWYPNCDVVGNPLDWWTRLELASIAIDRDGGEFWLKIKGTDGFPRLQTIPYHRCRGATSGIGGRVSDDDSGQFNGYQMRDGIVYYASGKPAAYRISTDADNKVYAYFPASDVIHLFDPKFSKQGRGLPAFTHALEELKTMLASEQDERTRLMIVSRLHLIEYNEDGGPNLDDPSSTLLTQTNNATGDEFGVQMQDYSGGIRYMRSNSGDKIEQIKHENPGEAWKRFYDHMVRIALAGVKWPYSLVWEGAGQGTDARAEIIKARKSIIQRQKTLNKAALNAFTWAYSVFQVNGRLPLLDYPMSWTFSRPPRLTVDDGRESKMEMDRWITGAANLSEILESQGLGSEEDFYRKRAISVATRQIIAAEVADEMSKKSGVEIKIAERDMIMMTPNEMANQPQDQPSEPNPNP